MPYHTMDPAQAVERILEAKGMILDENRELERQYAILKGKETDYKRGESTLTDMLMCLFHITLCFERAFTVTAWLA